MIASYKLFLPYVFHVVKPEELAPYRTNVGRYEAVFYPPLKTQAETVAFQGKPTVTHSLLPAALQEVTDDLMVFGNNTLEANLLRIDFKAPEFDRRRGHEREDPPIDLVFSIANRWLAVLRTVLQSPNIRPVEASEWFWRLDYLNDAGEELPASVECFRMMSGRRFEHRANILDKAQWELAVRSTVEAEIPIYVPLMLDADAALPDIGTAITLASTALETLIESHLRRVAGARCAPPELWSWITNRDFHLKEPSTAEQFDTLLKIFSGRSLKDQAQLWTAFKNLNQARNSFVHGGRAEIGNVPVAMDAAIKLLESTKEIIRWIEQMAPEGDRWWFDPPAFEIAFAAPPIPTR